MNFSTKNTLLLAADIGGTKTRLGLYQSQAGTVSTLKQDTFCNAQFDSFEEIIREFLAGLSARPSLACLGLAGPVLGRRVQLTNLNWVIDADVLESQFGLCRVELINDLVATAMGVVELQQRDLLVLNKGQVDPQGVVAVIAPGTGLGQAFLLHHNGAYIPVASEGGHCSFAPENDLQLELWQFLAESGDQVSVEQVCSGRAIPVLYKFMRTKIEEPDWLARRIKGSKDQTPVIVEAALSSRDKTGQLCNIAERIVELFVDILASESANLALKTLATGGLYIGGGIPPRILSFFDQQRFMEIFSRGVYRQMLERIPVGIILNSKTALLGAAAYGFSKVN